MKLPKPITAVLALLLATSQVFSQNTNETHSITPPSTPDWNIPSSAKKGDQVNIKYTGNKYVKSVKVVPLPTTVTITPKCLTMIVGESAILQAEIYPDITGVDKNVTWSVSSGNAVTIDADGKVTAVSEGNATVTVTTNTNNKTDALVINVAAPSTTFVQKAFSVSSTKTVGFSKGNLQYNVNEKTWRFANHQWDFVGGSGTHAGNMGCNTNESAAGPWIDLFGWGTWTKNGTEPNSTSTTDADYKTGMESSGDFENVCKEGIESGWETLTRAEWFYLFNTRATTNDIRYSKAKVHGVNGLVLLPDTWHGSYTFANKNTSNAYASFAEIANDDWATLESEGAVFLPAAGNRFGTTVGDDGSYGYYWSSTAYTETYACYSDFCSLYVAPAFTDRRFFGRSVRLVRAL